ncbi:hypothetical protein B0H19DRAFT_1270462 [Mycena capillaripes]|nr:hypothetical protein B0H19DRAFT_1270462 [Mycena capillaripes]
MAAGGIISLSSEILLKIFEDPAFPTESLYALALLSRRLNFIALLIYYSRNGIDLQGNSAEAALDIDRVDFLSALQILPPGLPWTLAATQHSPITSLAIRMSLVPSQIWKTVLPAIASAVPNLSSVSITQTYFSDIELTHVSRPWASNLSMKALLTLHARATLVAHILAPGHHHLKTLIPLLSTITRNLAARGLTPRLSIWIDWTNPVGVVDNTRPTVRSFIGLFVAMFSGVSRVSLTTSGALSAPAVPWVLREVRATEDLKDKY